MLRVTTLYASSAGATAAYYTQYLTGADGEEPGRWCGEQADAFGLSGTVGTQALERLLSGLDPNVGTGLGLELKDRTLASGKVVRAVSGFDATLSAPKSLSVLWALTGDERLAECHDVAAQAVVDYLERFGATTRVRSNGARLHPDTLGLTVAAFRQTTSRLDDPQLHTHLVISAKVQTVDGRWLALDARFLKGHQRALGGLYQSVLRSELTAQLGVAFGEIVKGQAEIAGVPAELLRQFSKRSVQVDAARAAKVADFRVREGREPSKFERAAMEREASADTRGRKTGNTAPDLRERWLAEAATRGVTPQDVVTSVRDSARDTSRDNPDVPRVTTADIIEQLSTSASSWHRMDVVRAVCDVAGPHRGVTGPQWVRALDRAVDAVLAECIDLDPTPAGDVRVRRRESDGRSVWIEPTANRFTSPLVLAQEEHILAWASDAQPDIPAPSMTVERGTLDVVQYEAATAVAGNDALVVIVGPAGAGKTTMLRAAVDDLAAHGRPVFGVAPSAKAARVLEVETGMATDTVAKLLYEWDRPDRDPTERWRLPAGTTVVVDEAGMVSTNDLYQLTKLAAHHRWRLALVGDPRQLQAVGRGGMFAEVGTCTKPIMLEQIHRFTAPWEAAASLQLRHGNPGAFDQYFAHDRVVPGGFEEHLDTIAGVWIDRHQRGNTLAITATTNEHVRAINTRVQAVRLANHQLMSDVSTGVGDEERVYVGDVIVTRRNARDLTTDTGEMVRNRERWIVQAITPARELQVRQLDGPGVVTLPAGYVAEHVQLGYAATEHGNQGVTQTASLTLATTTMSGRGLYVGMTRGRDDNTVLVVTDTHDPAEARDDLEAIIAFDRVDVPAVAVRRQLAAMDRPTRRLQPRCGVPDWFARVRAEAVGALDEVRESQIRAQAQTQHRRDRWEAAQQRARDASTACAPHDAAVRVARYALEGAKAARGDAARAVERAKLGTRRDARQRLAHADDQLRLAQAAHDAVLATAAPFWNERLVSQEEERLAERAWYDHQAIDRHTCDPRVETGRAERLLDALDTWHDWATGAPVTTNRLRQAHHDLNAIDDRDWLRRQPTSALAHTLQAWATERGIKLETHPFHPALIRRSPAVDHDLGIEL